MRTEITCILETIDRIQKRSIREELAERFCDFDRLGLNRPNINEFNTRPIQLFTDDDVPYYIPIFRNEDGCDKHHAHEEGCCEIKKSCVFRIERVLGNTVTVRALIECPGECEDEIDFQCHNCCEERKPRKHKKFLATDSFKTIKLENIAAIRCLDDTFVDLCIR